MYDKDVRHMHKILTSDLLICDVILPMAENADLAPLIEQYNQNHPKHPMVFGSKSPLTGEEFADWQRVIGGRGNYVAGGSAANTLSALKQLLGDALVIDFIAAYGDDAAGHVIAESLTGDGFQLWPQAMPFPDVQTATSFVIVNGDGERSILGFAGTSKQKIVSAMTANTLPADYDIVFLPGSLWQKYGAEFAMMLYDSCIARRKKLWLSLPTHSQAGEQYNVAVRAIVPYADVVLANASELKRLYGCESLESALVELQSLLGGHVAFITDGGRGAYVVTQDTLQQVPSEPVLTGEVKNTLGAGDAAFAGFLYGIMKNMPYKKAAEIGMKLAAENIKHASARIPEPKKILDSLR